MSLSSSSLAAAVGASVNNVQFQSAAENLPRKILVIGSYAAAKTGIADEVPQLILNPSDAGNRYGFGSMLHRLIKAAFAGSNGVELWACPQAELGGAVVAEGTITVTGATTEAGTLHLYIAGDYVPVTLASGSEVADTAAAIAAAINADQDLPVSATSALGVVTLTAKSLGTWGNYIVASLNEGFNQETIAGAAFAVTALTSGASIPDISDALDGLGTGDDANENWFTDVVHGYGQDTTNLDAILTYVGAGNAAVGLYDKLVARPFRVLTGDTVAGSSGLSDLTTLGGNRKTDRANGVIAVPGSPNHPSEIAAIAIGVMARVNNTRAAQSYIGELLPGVIPGSAANRWTSSYDSRDTAVKAGISPTIIKSGAVYLQNVVSFYHPDNVPVSSNLYRSMRNISIVQNILNSITVNFSQAKWLGISIVADVTKVTNSVDAQKARDIEAVIDDLVALATSYESHAWIYTAAFTVGKLQEGGQVSIRAGATGFDATLPILVSGEGAILDTEVQADTSLAVLLG